MKNIYERSEISVAKSRATWRARFAAAPFLMTVMVLLCQVAFWAREPGIPESAASSNAVQNSPQIPAGTILPVRLENTISIQDTHPGDAVEARIMQEVPLPNRKKIPYRSEVKGSIVSVVKDSDGAGVKVTLKFNHVEARDQALEVATSLRAVASYKAVRAAQMTLTGPDSGTPAGWGNTVQIGGDIRFGDGGEVRDRFKQKVGKGVRGGVLVQVRANPNGGCEGPFSGDDHPQALWVFSADACGAFDLRGIHITQSSKKAPIGEITLHFEKEGMKLESGTAMLLRVVTQP
jgi:hypothetical protein